VNKPPKGGGGIPEPPKIHRLLALGGNLLHRRPFTLVDFLSQWIYLPPLKTEIPPIIVLIIDFLDLQIDQTDHLLTPHPCNPEDPAPVTILSGLKDIDTYSYPRHPPPNTHKNLSS